jgi:hypothetical protein
VRAQIDDPLRFPRYTQDDWVSKQNYQHHDIKELIDLWYAYNMMLASVIENIHPQKLENCLPHR